MVYVHNYEDIYSVQSMCIMCMCISISSLKVSVKGMSDTRKEG